MSKPVATADDQFFNWLSFATMIANVISIFMIQAGKEAAFVKCNGWGNKLRLK